MKQYLVFFGSGNPTANAGLSPTFLVFKNMAGVNATAPGITQIPTSTGLYYFSYSPTNAISFVIDGTPTGTALPDTTRYVVGAIDPVDTVYEILGTSFYPIQLELITTGSDIQTRVVSLGYSLDIVYAGIGNTASSFGNTATNPTTVFGYLKRLQEFNEGNSTFNKSTSLWDIYSRGSSTLLAEKTLNDSAGSVTKT